jgi:predicted kinase
MDEAVLEEIAATYFESRPNLNLARKNFSVFYIAVSGAGKTTITDTIVERCGATYVSNDEIRQILAGYPEAADPKAIGKISLRVWEMIVTSTVNHFVVFDAISVGFYQRPDSYLNTSKRHGFACYIIDMEIPRDTLVDRIRKRAHIVDTQKILGELDTRLEQQRQARKNLKADYHFKPDSSVEDLLAHLNKAYQATV